MTKEILKQTLEALESDNPYIRQLAASAVRKALEQQAEPVAQITPPGPITQYRIPTQRPWVGLTDEDRRKFAAAQYGWEDLLIAAEAKLKERNGY